MKRHQDHEPEISDSPTELTGIRDRAKEFISQTPLPHQSGQNCKVLLVSPSDISVVWDDVVEFIDLALKHSEGELISDDLILPLNNGEQNLWVALEEGEIIAAMITEIIPHPRKRVLRVITIGAKDGHGMDKWYDFLPAVEGFALNNECSSLEAWTRKGMARKLKDWKHTYMVITKELKGRMQ
jgi:hypothetical protein